jgi:hypothetical protein
MWMRGNVFGRRRRRASAGVVLLLLIPLVGYDYVRGELQKREEWTGTIVRVYAERSFPGSKSFNHYWDVRTASGEIRSPRIWGKNSWSAGRVGDYAIKQPGEKNPIVAARR